MGNKQIKSQDILQFKYKNNPLKTEYLMLNKGKRNDVENLMKKLNLLNEEMIEEKFSEIISTIILDENIEEELLNLTIDVKTELIISYFNINRHNNKINKTEVDFFLRKLSNEPSAFILDRFKNWLINKANEIEFNKFVQNGYLFVFLIKEKKNKDFL